MKSLVVYSSLTGNTKMVAEAIAQILPNCELFSVEQAPNPEQYDFISVGYWVDKGMPDPKAKKYLEKINHKTVALFGTLGAYPDSEHAKDCCKNGENLLNDPPRQNKVLGTYLCQGKVDPKLIARMQTMTDGPHKMDSERIARLAEAAKHPNLDDCLKAQECFNNFINMIEA